MISARLGLARSRAERIGSSTPQSAATVGVVPRDAELVGGVVVAVDEVRDGHVGERGEAVGDARRDVEARWLIVPSASIPEVEGEGRALGGRADPEVVQHDARARPAGTYQ